MKKQIGLLLVAFLSAVYANDSYYHNGVLVELHNMHITRSNSNSDINYYKSAEGKKVGITNHILLKCKDDVNCAAFLKTYGIDNYSNLTDKILMLKVDDIDNIFSLSRQLFESGKVEFAHPNFIKEKNKR